MLRVSVEEGAVDEGAVRRVVEEEVEVCEGSEIMADAAAEVKEVLAVLGRYSSGVIVVSNVSHWFSSGLKLRRLSPRPSVWSCERL